MKTEDRETIAIAFEAALQSLAVSPVAYTPQEALSMLSERLEDDFGFDLNVTFPAEAVAAVEEDAALRERLTETFNARAKGLGWTRNGKLLDEYRGDAFEFLMGIHAGLQATGLPGFNGMELTVASVRGADFVFPIERT